MYCGLRGVLNQCGVLCFPLSIVSVWYVVRRVLATGEYEYRGKHVDPSSITDIAIFAIEGERDDITGIGQTKAVLRLVPNLPKEKQRYLLQEKVGHYGVFNGSRWRNEIYPQVLDFIADARK